MSAGMPAEPVQVQLQIVMATGFNLKRKSQKSDSDDTAQKVNGAKF